MQVINVRCRQQRRQLDIAVFNRNRADIAGRHELVHDIADDAGDAGFAVGTGDAEHQEIVARIAVESICNLVQHCIDVFDFDIGDIRMLVFQRFGMHDDLGTILDGLLHKAVAVKHHALLAEEDGIRPLLAAVHHQTADFNIRYVFK